MGRWEESNIIEGKWKGQGRVRGEGVRVKGKGKGKGRGTGKGRGKDQMQDDRESESSSYLQEFRLQIDHQKPIVCRRSWTKYSCLYRCRQDAGG